MSARSLLVSHMRYGRSVSSEISQRELRNNSGDIMRRLVNGPALAAAFRGAPRIDHQRLRADLDRAVDQDITPHG
ncbi:hypothetical protein MCEMAEM6B_02536 [Mycobacteriaceae bacterium]